MWLVIESALFVGLVIASVNIFITSEKINKTVNARRTAKDLKIKIIQRLKSTVNRPAKCSTELSGYQADDDTIFDEEPAQSQGLRIGLDGESNPVFLQKNQWYNGVKLNNIKIVPVTPGSINQSYFTGYMEIELQTRENINPSDTRAGLGAPIIYERVPLIFRWDDNVNRAITQCSLRSDSTQAYCIRWGVNPLVCSPAVLDTALGINTCFSLIGITDPCEMFLSNWPDPNGTTNMINAMSN